MSGELTINLIEPLVEIGKINLSIGIFADYAIDIYTKVDESYVDLVKNKGFIKEMAMSFDDSVKTFDNKQLLKQIGVTTAEKFKNGTLFTDFERITITGRPEKVAQYLKNNPGFLDKEIVYGIAVDLNESTLKEIKSNLSTFSNMKYIISGNSEPVSFEVYEKTVIAIGEIVSHVKRYDYSPLEALMHAYDLVRDRFYVEENDSEDYRVSRDLSLSLLGDKIVCLGFANIFNQVATLLGFNSSVFLLNRTPVKGHARNLIYLNDEKYGVEGLYFFDPTFDCKFGEDNIFLLEYLFFCKSYDEIDELSRYVYYPMDYKYFDIDSIIELEDSFEGKDVIYIDDFINFLRDTKVNTMLRLANRKTLEIRFDKRYTPSDLMVVIDEVRELADKPLTSNVFLEVLYNVRRNEYYENPSRYLFDMNSLACILYNSRISDDKKGALGLMEAILGEKNYNTKHAAVAKVKSFIGDNDLEKDINRVKLTKTLRSLYEKRLATEEESLRTKL